MLIRIHRRPCEALFCPSEVESLPIPAKYLDIMRRTETDLPDKAENSIEDYWTTPITKTLSAPWTGRTMLWLRRPLPPKANVYAQGEHIQYKGPTERPETIHPKVWAQLGPQRRAKETAFWKVESAKREAERLKYGKKQYIEAS